MARLCAKPTCASSAVRWFEVDAANRRVFEQARATASTISLCETHAARFSVPDGWTLLAEDSAAQTTAAVPAGVTLIEKFTAPEAAVARRHSREAPWFLAGSSTRETSEAIPDVMPTTDAVPTDTSPVAEPTVGSLLHRAFHGPDRDVDAVRDHDADRDTSTSGEPTAEAGKEPEPVASVRDISRRRRGTQTSIYDVELPFPPAESSPHVAVS